jgi:hypothetical protein
VSADRKRVLVADASPIITDGLFSGKPMTPFLPRILKIDRSTPIVAETEQIPNC